MLWNIEFNKMRMKYPDPKRLVEGVFPILKWTRTYDGKIAIGDLIAGITVALTLIPQSIAYASLAGFEPQYGLYASFAGGFVYAIMGTCPQINIGPTALLSLMTFTYTHGTNPDFAVLLCFVGGIIQLIAGSVQLGFLVEFVSLPVVSGFTSAAAITIASSQIKGLLGLKFSAETFIATWKGVFTHIEETRLQDTLLSLVCCIVLMGMKALKDIKVKDPENEKGRRTAQLVQRSLWFIGVSRNAVVVVLAAVVAFFVHQNNGDPLILTGKITPGLPTPQLPPFHTAVGNTTYTAGAMLSHLGSGLLVVPLVGIISNVAIAKAFARGRTLDATQEIVALGACNIIGAFFRSFPVNGSFTRSAVSDASGVRTPAAGFYTGIIVLLTLGLLTPYFYFIPRAALSAVIVCAVLHMVDLEIVKKLWKTSRLDLIPLVGTIICCLALGIELGLVCGVGVDVILLLYYHSRPPLDIKFVNNGVLPPHYMIHPVGGLHFAGAERVRSKLISLRNPKKNKPIPTLESLTVIPDDDIATRNATRSSTADNGNITVVIGNNGNVTNSNGIVTISNGVLNSSNGNGTDTNGVSNGINSVGAGNNAVGTGANGVGNGSNGVSNTNASERRNGATRGTGIERKAVNILVIYCGDLYRMDYTFLQSLLMLVTEWSRTGHIVWCDTRPLVKEQLDTVLQNPVFCGADQLEILLTNLSVIEESQSSVTSDTQL